MTGAELADLISLICAQWQESADTFSLLDNAVGDGDHGISIRTGTQAILAKIEDYRTNLPADVLKNVARDFLSAVGASIGPLYATGLLRMAQSISGKEQIDMADVPDLFASFVKGLGDRGKARVGEKTMMDVWVPAWEAFERSVQGRRPLTWEVLFEGCERAVQCGKNGLETTRDMVATKGRASRLGDRSKGHIDPGAFSAFQLMRLVMSQCCGVMFAGPVAKLEIGDDDR